MAKELGCPAGKYIGLSYNFEFWIAYDLLVVTLLKGRIGETVIGSLSLF